MIAPAILALLTMLVCISASAQVFPSDSMPPAQAGGVEMLEAVCPGQVTTTPAIGCRTGCPKFTTFYDAHGDWDLKAATKGHFLSSTSQDAALSVEGCESHAENWGGTVLLTQRSGKWVMVWYKAGVDTSQCHKVQLGDAREILVCMGSFGGQGNFVTALYVEDLKTPTGALMSGDNYPVFAAPDNTAACGVVAGPRVRSQIDKVEFPASQKPGQLVMVVTASLGRKSMTTEETKACVEGDTSVLPKTVTHRVEFIFDGHKYNVSPSSAKEKELFDAP